MADDALTDAEREALLDDMRYGSSTDLFKTVARIKADAVADALAPVEHLPDEWERHSNEVSKFIDQEHADDLRAALAEYRNSNTTNKE